MLLTRIDITQTQEKLHFEKFAGYKPYQGNLIRKYISYLCDSSVYPKEKGIILLPFMGLLFFIIRIYGIGKYYASLLGISCAPCERCFSAIASLGIYTIVGGVSYKEFCKFLSFDYMYLDGEDLLKQLRINITIKESVLEDEVFQMIDDGSFIPYNKGIVDFIFFQFDHQGTHTKNDWTVPVKN